MKEHRAATFDQLLERARGGDSGAASTLCTQHASLVRAVLRRRKPAFLRSEFDTDDLVQSVFAEVLRGVGRLENRGAAAFRHLLCLKAESKLKQKVRRAARARRARGERVEDAVVGVIAAPTRSPLDSAAGAEAAAAAVMALRSLDAESRAVVRLRYDKELSYREIAAQLRLSSAAAARMRYARALAVLRSALWPRA